MLRCWSVLTANQANCYEYQWNGYKRLLSPDPGRTWDYTYDAVSEKAYSGGSETIISYEKFWWNQNPWHNYGCTIYEGHWDWSRPSDESGNPTWVRDRWVASVDFYAYQAASYVSIDGSSDGLDFSMNRYYCTIDWEPDSITLLHGYYAGYWMWIGNYHMWPKYGGGWYYNGDPGSPRFHYEETCPVNIPPPPHPANPPSRR